MELIKEKNAVSEHPMLKYLSKDSFNLENENYEKRTFLDKLLVQTEHNLKENEILFDSLYQVNENYEKLCSFLLRKFHKKMEVIDNLFIQIDFVDQKSANLIMDEIQEEIEKLNNEIKSTSKLLNKENLNDQTYCLSYSS